MLRSDPVYLEAAFAALESREGSVLGFLDKHLGVDAAALKIICARLLES